MHEAECCGGGRRAGGRGRVSVRAGRSEAGATARSTLRGEEGGRVERLAHRARPGHAHPHAPSAPSDTAARRACWPGTVGWHS